MITDNGSCYRARIFTQELVDAGIRHTRTKPYRPQTNGKVERYNRTLLNEWAYAKPYRSEASRTRALDTWHHKYNHHRHQHGHRKTTHQPCQQRGWAEHLGGRKEWSRRDAVSMVCQPHPGTAAATDSIVVTAFRSAREAGGHSEHGKS